MDFSVSLVLYLWISCRKKKNIREQEDQAVYRDHQQTNERGIDPSGLARNNPLYLTSDYIIRGTSKPSKENQYEQIKKVDNEHEYFEIIAPGDMKSKKDLNAEYAVVNKPKKRKAQIENTKNVDDDIEMYDNKDLYISGDEVTEANDGDIRNDELKRNIDDEIDMYENKDLYEGADKTGGDQNNDKMQEDTIKRNSEDVDMYENTDIYEAGDDDAELGQSVISSEHGEHGNGLTLPNDMPDTAKSRQSYV